MVLAENRKSRAAIKFAFWGIATVVMVLVVVRSYTSGQMIRWYYYTTSLDGYAINTKTFEHATKENPVMVSIGPFDAINGPVAVPVKKGGRLPVNANGVISSEDLQSAKRVALEGDAIKVTVPWEIKETKGFKYKDSFKHKGVQTNPWAGVWNVLVVIAMGVTLGFMAEGFTDLLGWKISRIVHFEGH
jgi:hypothetical protein